MIVLGISAYYHDSAAAILRDGEIVAAVQEERFTRKKHDSRFPAHAIEYCLRKAGVQITDVAAIAFYDKPWIKFERLLETYLTTAPRGLRSFVTAMPVWLKEKLFLKSQLKHELGSLSGLKKNELPPILFMEHHQSHAASAFYPSPFRSAAVLCLDGVGEWATTSAWSGEGASVQPLWEIHFPHSLGMLYSAFTYYTGFKVNSGEYKVMGLAPYGRPIYVDKIRDHLIDIKPDGTFRLNMEYFNFMSGLTMTNSRFHRLFGGPPRKPESEVTQREMDLARSIQEVTEEVVLNLARALHRETGSDYLCLAGGVALNCVANGRLLREGPFKDIWIQPAAGDGGGALGCALSAWHQYFGKERAMQESGDAMKGGFLGPEFSRSEVRDALDRLGASYRVLSEEQLLSESARHLASGAVLGWFQGRMEYGPRALGGRSILGDPRNPRMQSTMNLKIKYRESFRPFAPAVLHEDASDYFELNRESPYMLIVAPVRTNKRIAMTEAEQNLFGIDQLNIPRSELPAVTHVDYSARVQTVRSETNPRFHALLNEFKKQTECSVLVNTSFNVRGEPIVCSVEDAYRCFMRTEMDALVIDSFILLKADQRAQSPSEDWKREIQLD